MTLPDALFGPLATRVAERAGLRVPKQQVWLLESRLEARRAARGRRESLTDYVELLLRDDAELDRLVEVLRVGETFFYRHPRQLRAIRRAALPEIAAACEAECRPMRIWSAGCATGEEAYTLAMLVHASKPDLRVEVLATDLSASALHTAREAVYDAERTHNVPPEVAVWALHREGERRRVAESVRACVTFRRHNLLHDEYPKEQDLILCRNVLIYFDAEVRRRVLESLFRASRMHGWVALGYADSIGDTVGLEPLRTDEGTLYRRIGTPSVPPPPPPPSTDPPEPWPIPRETKPALRGEQVGERARREVHQVLSTLLESGGEVLDLRELQLADEGVGGELRRIAAAMRADGRTLVLEVSSPGIERFLRRHGVVPPARVRR